MNKALAALAFALSVPLALGGCQRAAAPAPLAGAKIGGSFTLIDQDGRRFSSTALEGRYAVVYFGYTFCPDVCPLDMAVLGKGLKRFEAKDAARGARVVPVFITVDPTRDTPMVLKQYVAAFHPRMIGLTGSEAQIVRVEKEYAAVSQKQPPAPGAEAYLVQHTRMAVLFGPDAKPIALVPIDTDADKVAATLDQWVR